MNDIQSHKISFVFRSFFLLATSWLGLSSNNFHFSNSLNNWGIQSLLAVNINTSDATILNTLFKKDSGDRSNNFEFLNESGCGDMLADFGDAGNNSVVACLIEEDGIVGFFFNFSFSPFLSNDR